MIGGQRRPLRIHELMDDASRYVVALEAHHTEQEMDMIGMLADALRRHSRPEALYLDNGSTYRGEALSLACMRMGVGLLHARPYDPQARGKGAFGLTRNTEIPRSLKAARNASP